MLDRIRDGESAVLVLRGAAGIGKTALMHYCARQASGCRVAQVAGVESELEMPFAALQQLCAPMLGDLTSLPAPQQQALRVAFGLTAGNPPDRFMVGLAALGLVAEVAAERPLVCLIDDAQWLDEASGQVLAFVGRRLLAEHILLLLSVRETDDERLFPVLPTLTLEGLVEEDARALLGAAVPGHLDQKVRDRIVAETGGNPLALLELPRGMSPAELAGGFGDAPSRLRPRSHREALCAACQGPGGADTATDSSGRGRSHRGCHTPLGVRRRRWACPTVQAIAAESDQLLEIGTRVHFRHPLVRSAVYAAAAPEDRRAAHLALGRRDRCPRRSPTSGLAPGRCCRRTRRSARFSARTNGRHSYNPGPDWLPPPRFSSVRWS